MKSPVLLPGRSRVQADVFISFGVETILTRLAWLLRSKGAALTIYSIIRHCVNRSRRDIAIACRHLHYAAKNNQAQA
jgi:hypothetical protein